jgi:hypothetical protein
MDGPLTNSSPGDQQKSLDAVYDRLRRCSYEEARIEYTLILIQSNISSTALEKEIVQIVDPGLKKLGWSYSALQEFEVRFQKV